MKRKRSIPHHSIPNPTPKNASLNAPESLPEPEDLVIDPQLKLMTTMSIVVIILLTIVIYNFWQLSRNPGYVVLPGGVTYLGPPRQENNSEQKRNDGVFYSHENEIWTVYHGSLYPFSFEKPSTLPLAIFANDPTDAIAINWNNINPTENILMHVENITKNNILKQYSTLPKIALIKEHWWKQFTSFTGSKEVTAFINSKGMQGYRTKFLTESGEANGIDVFFEVPKQKNLLVRFGNGVLDPAVFEHIIDTFMWETVSPTPKR